MMKQRNDAMYRDDDSMAGGKWTPGNPKSLAQQFVEGAPDLYPLGWTAEMAEEEAAK